MPSSQLTVPLTWVHKRVTIESGWIEFSSVAPNWGDIIKAVWQLSEAKNRLSELVKQTMTFGAQVITKHGHPAVVVASAAEQTAHPRAKDRRINFAEWKATLRPLFLRRS
jgi:prevent-host-death family protein